MPPTTFTFGPPHEPERFRLRKGDPSQLWRGSDNVPLTHQEASALKLLVERRSLEDDDEADWIPLGHFAPILPEYVAGIILRLRNKLEPGREKKSSRKNANDDNDLIWQGTSSYRLGWAARIDSGPIDMCADHKSAFFVGRTAELEELRRRFTSGCRIQAIVGPSGFGKTALAAEYGDRFSRHYHALFWLAGSDVHESYLDIANRLGLPQATDRVSRTATVARAKDLVERKQRFLLVVDDFDLVPGLARELPECSNGDLLLTSKRMIYEVSNATVRSMILGGLRPDDARRLLLEKLGTADPENSDESPSLNEICKLFGRIPRALEIIGDSLRDDYCTPRMLLNKLQRKRYDNADHVLNALDLTFEDTIKHSTAKQILLLLCCFAPETLVTHGMIHRAAQFLGGALAENLGPCEPDSMELRETLAVLNRRGLVRWCATSCTVYSRKELYHFGRMIAGEAAFASTAALGSEFMLAELGTPAGVFYADWFEDTSPGLLRHAREMRQVLIMINPQHPRIPELTERIGLALYSRGWFRHAQQLLLEGLNQTTGQPADQARIRRHLGMVAHDLCNFAEARRQYRLALSTQISILGGNHPETISTLISLGALYCSLGKRTRSTRIYDDVLRRMERSGGQSDYLLQGIVRLNRGVNHMYDENSPDAADAAEADFRLAESLLRRTLAGDHPIIAQCLESRAAAATRLGKFTLAVELLRDASRMFRVTLGSLHPATGGALERLGQVLLRANCVDEAEDTIMLSLRIGRRTARQTSVLYCESLNTLGTLLGMKGDWRGAIEALSQADLLLQKCEGCIERGRLEQAILTNLSHAYKCNGQLNEASTISYRLIEKTMNGKPNNIT